jgi:hypothetical protein
MIKQIKIITLINEVDKNLNNQDYHSAKGNLAKFSI